MTHLPILVLIIPLVVARTKIDDCIAGRNAIAFGDMVVSPCKVSSGANMDGNTAQCSTDWTLKNSVLGVTESSKEFIRNNLLKSVPHAILSLSEFFELSLVRWRYFRVLPGIKGAFRV